MSDKDIDLISDDSGRKKNALEKAEAIKKEYDVRIIQGLGLPGWVKTNGYRYKGALIDSFTQVSSACAIRLNKRQKMSWFTGDSPVVPKEYCSEQLPYSVGLKGDVAIFEFAMGNGGYPTPSGAFSLTVDDKTIRFSLKKESHLYSFDGLQLYLQIKRKKYTCFGNTFTLDEFIKDENTYVDGLAYLFIPNEGEKKRHKIKVKGSGNERSTNFFRLGFCRHIFDCDIDEGIEKVLGEKEISSIDGKNIYFGDIHIHTAETKSLKTTGCGTGTLRENLSYARDVSGLDFAAITDHDWQLDKYDFKNVVKANSEYNSKDFVTINAYEWTSANYGHRNVYFEGEVMDLVPFDFQKEPHKKVKYGKASLLDPTPNDLWNYLDNTGLKAMTIPHHPNAEQFPLDMNKYFSERYDRAVEVYSVWGSYFKNDSELNMTCERVEKLCYENNCDHILGFLASSDGHDSHAGEANLTKSRKHMAHYLGSGRVAVIADNLTRKSIFNGIYDRHCYGTTGAKILLNVLINDVKMGQIIKEKSEELNIYIHAICTEKIKEIRIIYNGKIVYCKTGFADIEYKDTLKLKAVSGAYYIEVIQDDYERAWSSPIYYLPE